MKVYMTRVSLVVTCMAVGLVATGCGKKVESSLQEQTDLSAATDLFSSAPRPPAQPDPQKTIASVNGTTVTQGELMQEMGNIAQRLQGRVPPERMMQMQDEIAHQAMENIILRTILLAEVEKRDVPVEDGELDAAIERLTRTLPAGVTLDEQLQQLGMTQDRFQDMVVRDIQINKFLEEKVEGIADPTDEEIVAFHEENSERFNVPENVRASHILVAFDEADDDAARAAKRAKAEELRDQLVEGADFAQLAMAESDCPSRARGGDLGQFTRNQMVPPFSEAAFTQEEGEIGEIVETQFGYHIIKVDKHEQAHTLSLDDSREMIAQQLLNQRKQTLVNEYLMELREAANVEFMQ